MNRPQGEKEADEPSTFSCTEGVVEVPAFN